MAQAVTMFDGWFAGQRFLSTTQRYLQVTAKHDRQTHFQHSVSQSLFLICFVLLNSIPLVIFIFFNVQPHHHTTHTKKKKTNENR